jgi:4-diphosphocytidyl-2-C-methyl-D-erythritol kinase
VNASAQAKLNLALAVGPVRADGKHELLTVYQRLALADGIELEAAAGLRVDGFAEDTLVRAALEALAVQADVEPNWHVRIEKHVPVAAGVGGGSSDAATAIRLANDTLAEPLTPTRLRALAATLGADLPFFLAEGPQLGSGDGGTLAPLDLPQEFSVLLVVPHAAVKSSTRDVYAAFDARGGAAGWEERRDSLLAAVERVRRPRDLAALPPNDLASSPLADELRGLGAFRADVTGAGPAVYGLFDDEAAAEAAGRALGRAGSIFLTGPAWYG